SDRDSVCSADRSACLGGCEKLDEVWCARFSTGDGTGYLCSLTRNACWGLLDNPELRRGRFDFGECSPQKAAGPAAARAAATPAPAPPPARPAPPPARPASPPARSAPPARPAPPPRGFFCSSSAALPAAGFCTREKGDCQRARD